MQRLAQSPRVPRLEGIRFETDANPEMHYLTKSLLFRPLHLPDQAVFASPERPSGAAAFKASDLRILQMYEQLCTAPAGQAAWPAQNGGPGVPGPFERGFKAFMQGEEVKCAAALRKRITTCTWPSLWETQEVHTELDKLADALEIAESTGGGPQHKPDGAAAPSARGERMTIDEYYALRRAALVKNFDGIAAASHEKPKRRIDDDAHIKEEPILREGGDADGRGLDQVEAADEVAKAGLAKLGSSTTIAHRFTADEMKRILAYDTRERTSAYSKDLLDAMPSLADGSLPSPLEVSAVERRRKELREEVIDIYGGHARRNVDGIGRAGGDNSLLSRIELRQREYAEGGGDGQDDEADVPPELTIAPPAQDDEQAAHFAPCDRWRRPSDYIKYMMERFEAGLTSFPGKSTKKKSLSHDQVCFLALFAEACDAAWTEERDDVPVSSRKTRHLLLMGQGGSGKTAIVQELQGRELVRQFPLLGI